METFTGCSSNRLSIKNINQQWQGLLFSTLARKFNAGATFSYTQKEFFIIWNYVVLCRRLFTAGDTS